MAGPDPQALPGQRSFKQRYLFAFATLAEILHHLRTQALPQEFDRAQEIVDAWTRLQGRVEQLVAGEVHRAEQVRVRPLRRRYKRQFEAIAADPLFQRTFSNLPTNCGLVELDNLVAPQRTINLDYVERLRSSFPSAPSMEDLMEICLSPARGLPPVQHLEVAPDLHVFTSPSSDLRYLGSFLKAVTPEDLGHAAHGGAPVLAVIAFVGYGGAPVNALKVGGRVVLNNGFHRVHALRSLGVEAAPVVLQHVANPDLEFPPVVVELPKEYLLNAPRPVLVKDFFEPDFAITLRVRERVKLLSIGIDLTQHDVPV